MSANAAVAQVENQRPVIMFVDDEQRVLKSMRAMFRRDYEVLLANSGEEALKLLAERQIDVVVSDQRMPYMTGVEVLTEIKQRSPDTLRILLTGYADLAAVEASINDAEVFRYLMKPCPADEIRGAVQEGLALSAAVERSFKSVQATAPEPVAASPEVVEVAESQPAAAAAPQAAEPQQAAKPAAAQPPAQDRPRLEPVSVKGVEVLVVTADKELVDGVRTACPGQTIHQAEDLERGMDVVRQQNVGVLVTDITSSEHDIKKLSTQVRMITPDIVIIVASDRSDANVLIQMINSGQVFRFLLKPLQTGQCRIWLRSAMQRFVENHSLLDAGITASADGTANAMVEPGLWTKFRNWFLGVQE